MKPLNLCILILLSYTGFGFAQSSATGIYYVDSDVLDVRLAPNTNAQLASQLKKGQKVKVFEVESNWARISEYYDGSIEGKAGKVAMWVDYLNISRASTKQPKGTDLKPELLEDALKASDDFSSHKDALVSISKKLIESGKCSVAEFKSLGGWVRSTMHRPKMVYFTYCGGLSASNILYYDLTTGKIFK